MGRFEEGWIKIYRKMLFGDIARNANLLAIWVTLLGWATRFETTLLWKGEQRILPEGSVVLGLAELAAQLSISKKTTLKWIRYLVKSGRISYEVSPLGSVITICKWKEYQNKDDIGVTLTSLLPSREGHREVSERVTLNGEEKKERIEEEEYIQKQKFEIKEAIEEWGKTLTKYGMEKDPRFDEATIASLIQTHGLEKTKLALVGARFESPSKNYNPAAHVSIRRLLRPDVFDLFVNLGAAHIKSLDTAGREWVEANVDFNL